MVSAARKRFNASFSEQKYQQLIRDIHPSHDPDKDFRIAETPVFVSKAFRAEIMNLFADIKAFLTQPQFAQNMHNAVPQQHRMQNESRHAEFVCIDFAVCKDQNGNLYPQLIEMQGVASLFCYQRNLNLAYKRHFDIPQNFSYLYNNLTDNDYIALLKKLIVKDCPIENVVLLEIEPHKQKTRIDFSYTQKDLGITPVCVTQVFQEGRALYYLRNGVKTRIQRIYNRVIFDELERRPDLQLRFNFYDDLDLVWVAHPNWFFKISKYNLPFINSKYVPQAWFLSDLTQHPDDLENYVLKPLFSFAGAGVVFDLTPRHLADIPAQQRRNYILQRKVTYEPFVETPDIPAKAEIRMLCIWDEDGQLTPLTNLARLSKGKMLGVDFNKDHNWIGGSAVFMEE